MNTPENSLVLLMTATIDPGATPMVARNDPLMRLRDYQESLETWLACGAARKIVLYENSGYDIGPLKKIVSRFPGHNVEFHSFLGNDSGPSRGKGYSELAGIARVLSQSSLLQNCKYIAKCTGRLTVGNAAKLFRLIEAEQFDVMCPLKMNLRFAPSRFFVATPRFISDYLVPQQSIIDDNRGVFFEHALACATARALSDRGRWLPFPIFPDIRGISGTYGVSQTYTSLKRALLSMFHRLENYVYAREG